MKKNYWKLFTAWATGLRHDVFFVMRLKMSAVYVLIAAALLFTAWFIDQRNHHEDIVRAIYVYDNVVLEERTRESFLNALGNFYDHPDTQFAVFLVVWATGVGSYLLAGRALRPIRDAMAMQERFIADASHELRTPLSVMKTSSELVLMDATAASREEAINSIKSNLEEVDRMSNIINRLLAVAQIGVSGSRNSYEQVNLADVVRTRTEILQDVARGKNILFGTELDDVYIKGNRTALEEMVVNIIKNAIVYTGKGGRILVRVHRMNGKAIFSVEDTGVGISDKDIRHIFDPFFKADVSRTERKSSYGLGLAIVKEIVTRHGGTISVESEIGKGSIFRIELPVAG